MHQLSNYDFNINLECKQGFYYLVIRQKIPQMQPVMEDVVCVTSSCVKYSELPVCAAAISTCPSSQPCEQADF